MTEDPRQAAQAELTELLLQGRPEHVMRFLLDSQPGEVRAEAGRMADGLAALAAALPPEPLPLDASGADPLRARLMATLSSRHRRREAVLVIDMQNDHLTQGSTVEVPRARAIVPALADRLSVARTAGVPVIYVVDNHAADDPDLELWTTHNVAGTSGAEVWPQLAPKAGDSVVAKPSYSAFTGSSLDEVLGSLAVDTLVLTGCLTEMGMLATAMDALQRGYAVEIPRDSQAGSGPVAEEAAMASLLMMPPYAPARKERLAAVDARLRATSPAF